MEKQSKRVVVDYLFLSSYAMRNTIALVAVIGTFIATACLLGLIAWSLNDLSYKETMQHAGLQFFMLIFGWIPSVIVARDLYEKRTNEL